MTFSFEEESFVRDRMAGVDVVPVRLVDDLHRRLFHALDGGSDLDVAVLVRQWLRRLSERDLTSHSSAIESGLRERLKTPAAAVGLRQGTEGWTAEPFVPSWSSGQGVADAAAVAGSHKGFVALHEECDADPFFTSLTGWPKYKSHGQRAAARAALSMTDGATLLTVLPTGSGKTEVALCLAGRQRGAVTLVIVPTVALAYDFERRFRDHYVKRAKASGQIVTPDQFTFAWTAQTTGAERETLRARLTRGQQPLLVTSPESITLSLCSQLHDLAVAGRLSGFVVDEAHLVTQWGRSFRPDFRTFSLLRRELIASAETSGRSLPVTLLLSATVNADVAQDLYELFDGPGPCRLIAANALRAEPDFWVAPETTAAERQSLVLEALARLPRPLVLYVTRPAQALEWKSVLLAAGYQRLAVVTGESTAQERIEALEGLRTDGDAASRFDVVVATSAFGLGIDYGHVRSVVHACVPETVDRWYQEVGRGGRDGHRSVAMLLPSETDWPTAKSLGVTVLSPDTADRRWKDLRRRAKTVEQGLASDLNRAAGGAEDGSYSLRWNSQLVQGMVELEVLAPIQLTYDDAQALSDGVADGYRPIWFGFRERRAALGESGWWDETWGPWQKHEMARSGRSLARMRGIVAGIVPVCSSIQDEYAPDARSYEIFGEQAALMEPTGECGRCPACRALGRTRHVDLAAEPIQRWPIPDSSKEALSEFIAIVGSDTGLAVIVAEDPAACVARLGQRLVERGVRHFGGVPTLPSTQTRPLFHDRHPIGPDELSPFPSCIAIYEGDLQEMGWMSLVRRSRPREVSGDVLDVLVVSRRVLAPKGLRHKSEQTARVLLEA